MTTALKPKPKARRLWTFEELAARLPESNQPVELWDGEIVMSPAPKPDHQEIVLNFATRLKAHVQIKKSGRVFISPVDVVFSPRRSVQPDVVFVAAAHLGIVADCIRGVPDLVAEVISEGSWRRDRVDKKDLYEQLEVPEYWIIDPEAGKIEVFALVRGAYRLHCRAELDQPAASKLLPGFTVTWLQLRD